MSRPTARRILFDGTKLLEPHVDGVKRYVWELLKAFAATPSVQDGHWRIDVALNGKYSIPLRDVLSQVDQDRRLPNPLPRFAGTLQERLEKYQRIRKDTSLP